MDILTEARGIAAREPGTVFTNDNGDTLTLVDILYFPPERGAYEDADTLEDVLSEWEYKFDGHVWMHNDPRPALKSIMMTLWEQDDGGLVAHGSYYAKLKPGQLAATWSNKDFGDTTGFKFGSVASKNQATDMKPGDVLNGKIMNVNYAVRAITAGLKTRDLSPEKQEQIVSMIANAVAGTDKPTIGAGEDVRMHEMYTGEYAAPLCLAKNSKLVTGDLDGVERELLKPQGLTWASMKQVQWPSSSSEKLVDSYLIAGDYKLGVSSKDSKGGAGASVSGIMDIVTKKKSQMPKKLLKDYADFIKAIELILDKTAVEGPLEMATYLHFIEPKDAAQIVDRMASHDNNLKTLTPTNKKILKDGIAVGSKGKTVQFDHPNYSVGYHLLSILAKLVAAHLNTLDATDFFKAVLNYADMVQVYATAKKVEGDNAAFTQFRLVYPPTFSGTIKVDAGKNYAATGKPKGKLVFKLGK